MRIFKTSILLLFIIFTAQSQVKLEVHYDIYTNFGLPVQKSGILKIIDKKSQFDIQIKKTNSKFKLNEKGEYIKVVSFTEKDFIDSYIIDFEKKIFILKENILGETYIVVNDLHVIDWEIVEKTKKIGTFNCQLAIGEFRGRKYNVWFTTKIPSRSGPWKLYGLPGLILEVTDNSKQVQFIMKSIKSIDSPIIIESLDGSNKISFEEYVDIKKNYKKEVLKKIDSKMPRGIRGSSVISKSKGLEDFNEIN